MTAAPSHLTGGCQCGACRYEVSAAPLFGYVCHCLECRKQSGSAFSASMIVSADAVSATGPIATWMRRDGENPELEALFCSECGSRLFHHAVPRQEIMRVRIGTLDDSSWFRPAAEFFVKRRFDWLGIDGDPVQCLETFEPEQGEAIWQTWQRLTAG